MAKLKSDYFGNSMKLRCLIDKCSNDLLINNIGINFICETFNLDIKGLLKYLLSNILTNNNKLNNFYIKILHLINNNNNNNNAMNLMDIGDDLLCNILKYLDIKSIINFENINRECCYIARIPNIFEKISIKIDSIQNQKTHSSLIPNSVYNNKKELYKRFSLVKKVKIDELKENKVEVVCPKVIELVYLGSSFKRKIPLELLHIKGFHCKYLVISNDNVNDIMQFF